MKIKSNMKIRAAQLPDKESLIKVHTNSIEKLCSSFYSEKEIKSWIDVPETMSEEQFKQQLTDKLIIVAEKDNEIVGFGIFIKEEGIIDGLMLNPKHIREGIGSKLLKKMEEEAAKCGFNEINLCSTLNAVDFYKIGGYEELGKSTQSITDEVQISCIKMKKCLK